MVPARQITDSDINAFLSIPERRKEICLLSETDKRQLFIFNPYSFMKKFFTLAIMALVACATLLVSSCAKEIIVDDPFEEGIKNDFSVFDIDLQFDAPELSQTTVYFYDEQGVMVNSETIVVPQSVEEVVNASFLSETKPRYLYTPGLQNVDENGYLTIPEGSVATKASKAPVKLVIR